MLDLKLEKAISSREMEFDLDSLRSEMIQCNRLIQNYNLLVSVSNAVIKHGPYAGFETILSQQGLNEVNTLVGIDICSVENIDAVYSSEILRDTINKFFVKIHAMLGRIGDRISNVIRTFLPFKEKYLKELTELKQVLKGRPIDESAFANKSVASAIKKETYNKCISQYKAFFKALTNVVTEASSMNLDNFLDAADNIPRANRTTVGTFMDAPWTSWFTSGKVSELGYKGSDVISVMDDAIELIQTMPALYEAFNKWNGQINRLEQEISQLRATGKVDEAIEKRENSARAFEFMWSIMEAMDVYHQQIRREMYFATYLGRAARACLK